jgi:lysyl-tRNA synthetase class I
MTKRQKFLVEGMPFMVEGTDRQGPWVVATGFTTSFLGDERTLREFIVGDHIVRQLRSQGKDAQLYLINDSYDPLHYKELRIALNKDERLIKKWRSYCGQPIAEVPDPFGCHESYAEHFAAALLNRLRDLDIHPVLLDTYQAYRRGDYAPFVRTTLNNHERIQSFITRQFDGHNLRKLFSPQCPCCKRIDHTRVIDVAAEMVTFTCGHCGTTTRDPIENIRGKLAWKLDCAARWNLYDIHLEAFSKKHLSPLGSFDISRFLSENFFGGRVPQPVRYGSVLMDRDMSMRLLEFMPPPLFKQFFVQNVSSDMTVNKDTVYNFCHRAQVRSNCSYVDYVKKDLPIQAISAHPAAAADIPHHAGPPIDGRDLVRYGNRFSFFYYGREFGIFLPEEHAIRAVDRDIARVAEQVLAECLSLRDPDRAPTPEDSRVAITERLKNRVDIAPAVYRYLREVFGQKQGPSINTLLALLPVDYLRQVRALIRSYCETERDKAAHHDGWEHLGDWNIKSLVAAGKAWRGSESSVVLSKCNF